MPAPPGQRSAAAASSGLAGDRKRQAAAPFAQGHFHPKLLLWEGQTAGELVRCDSFPGSCGCGDCRKTRYIRSVRELVRQNFRYFLLAILAAIALRLFFVFRFPGVTTDSFVYGDIAKNWLQHGIYGLSGTEEISPTYIRLPGYPAFLAFIFAIFGMEHYRAVLVAQMFVDIGTCFIIADMARPVIS